MMKKKMLSLGIFILIVSATSACSAGNKISKAGGENAQSLDTVSIHADFPSYNNMDELVNTADIIVRGKILFSEVKSLDIAIKESKDPKDEKANPMSNSDLSAMQEEPIVYTVSDFEITEVLKGDNIKVTEKIQVKQLGGAYNNKLFVGSGIEHFAQNQEYLLFLKQYEDSPYSLLNPVQAMYEIQDDKIVPREKNSIKFDMEQLRK